MGSECTLFENLDLLGQAVPHCCQSWPVCLRMLGLFGLLDLLGLFSLLDLLVWRREQAVQHCLSLTLEWQALNQHDSNC